MLLPGDKVKDCEVIAPLGSGGMARLYLARRRGVGGFSRLVTLKLVHPHLIEDERIVKLFLDEARISAHVAHPNVVHVEEVGKFGDSYFIAMEYVHGVSLAELLARLNERRLRLRPKLCVWLAGQIAEALHAAHEAKGENGAPLGIVHRDVSPQNVLVGHTGHVKLIDFGIARSQTEADPRIGARAVLGKLRYMSPEQLRLERADRRTDVYALGVMLWEMLAGRNLLRCRRLDDEGDWTIRENPPPPSKYSAHSTPSLDRVVSKAIAFDPADRYDSAFQFRTALLRADPAAATLDAPMVAALMRSMLGDELDRRRASWPSEVSGALEGETDGPSSQKWSLEDLTSNNLGLFPILEAQAADELERAAESAALSCDTSQAGDDAAIEEDSGEYSDGDEYPDFSGATDDYADTCQASGAYADTGHYSGDYADVSEQDDDDAEPTVAIRSARPPLAAVEPAMPMLASSYTDMMLAASMTSMSEPTFASVRADLMLALATASVSYDPREGLRVENSTQILPSRFVAQEYEPTTVHSSVIDIPEIHAHAELVPASAIDTLNCPPVLARPLESLTSALAFRAAVIASGCLAVGMLLGSLLPRPAQGEPRPQQPPVEYVVVSTAAVAHAALDSVPMPSQPSAATPPTTVTTPEVDVTRSAEAAAAPQDCAAGGAARTLTGSYRDALDGSNAADSGGCRTEVASERSGRSVRYEARVYGSRRSAARLGKHWMSASWSTKRAASRKAKWSDRADD
jgi:serine/threonine protein kinase